MTKKQILLVALALPALLVCQEIVGNIFREIFGKILNTILG
jgi:hypothetical protein